MSSFKEHKVEKIKGLLEDGCDKHTTDLALESHLVYQHLSGCLKSNANHTVSILRAKTAQQEELLQNSSITRFC